MNDDLKVAWPEPDGYMFDRAEYEAIWNAIRTWDIAVPGAYVGHSGATGNHVRAILDALDNVTINCQVLATATKINNWIERESDKGFNRTAAFQVLLTVLDALMKDK